MKSYKFILAFLCLFCTTAAGFCDLSASSPYGSKLKLKDASSISEQANSNPAFEASPFSEALQNPFINATLNGYTNMVQGINNCPTNYQEQQKMQNDYTRQQLQNPDN